MLVVLRKMGWLHLQRGAFRTQAFQQARRTGNGQPRRYPCQRRAGDDEGEGNGDPERKALKTVHQYPQHADSELRSQLQDQIRWAVFLGDQVRHPPGSQRGQRECRAWVDSLHDAFDSRWPAVSLPVSSPSPVSIHSGRRTWRWAHAGTPVRAQRGERKLELVVASDARVRAAVGGARPCPPPNRRLEFHLERRALLSCARGLGNGRTGRASLAHYCNAQTQVGLVLLVRNPSRIELPGDPGHGLLPCCASLDREGEHATGKVRAVRTKLRSNGTILRRMQQAALTTKVASVAGSAAGTGSRGCQRSDGTCARNATGR